MVGRIVIFSILQMQKLELTEDGDECKIARLAKRGASIHGPNDQAPLNYFAPVPAKVPFLVARNRMDNFKRKRSKYTNLHQKTV